MYGKSSLAVHASCAIVAEMVGGVASTSKDCLPSSVLTPEGRVIAVWYVTDDFVSSWLGKPASNHDEVALVAWVSGMPAAVHFVDADRWISLLEMLAVTRTPYGAGIDLWLHANLMFEPTLAEVYGVRTVLLDDGRIPSQSMDSDH